MKRNTFQNFASIAIIVLLAACTPLASPATTPVKIPTEPLSTATATTPETTVTTPPPTATIATPAEASQIVSPTTTPPCRSGRQFIAYVRAGRLVVTDVSDGMPGCTTQYESEQVTDPVWSPSGEFVAFVSSATGEPHIFYTNGLNQSSPTDLGPGSTPVWSPDSQSIAYIGGTFPDDNIWLTTIDNPAPRQLTFEMNYAWGRPAFTPDGQSLVVAGADRNYMGAQGNTSFTLETLVLDGSGTRTPLPGATPFEGARLPYDLHFSSDGTRLAFSTSFHLSACASPGAYYVSNADGSNRQEIVSPSLKTAIDTNQEHYHVGLSYAWSPASDALVALGNVVDCDPNSSTMGQIVAGPQMSIIGLDGSEQTIIPGFFYGVSMDGERRWIAAAHYQDGFQDMNPTIEIYSAQTGQLILTLGPGNDPQFQP